MTSILRAHSLYAADTASRSTWTVTFIPRHVSSIGTMSSSFARLWPTMIFRKAVIASSAVWCEAFTAIRFTGQYRSIPAFAFAFATASSTCRTMSTYRAICSSVTSRAPAPPGRAGDPRRGRGARLRDPVHEAGGLREVLRLQEGPGPREEVLPALAREDPPLRELRGLGHRARREGPERRPGGLRDEQQLPDEVREALEARHVPAPRREAAAESVLDLLQDPDPVHRQDGPARPGTPATRARGARRPCGTRGRP